MKETTMFSGACNTREQKHELDCDTRGQLTRILGSTNVLENPDDLAFYSSDIYSSAVISAVAVVRPPTVENLAAAVAVCTRAGYSVFPRGAGLSYTSGYLPTTDRSVMLDLSGLDRIVEINLEDMYVVVESGCTWKALYEALRPLGVRTPYFGPMSGYSSTVGGALSQGSIFLGSTQHGSTAESTLGLEVVLADGTVLVTGSAATPYAPSPFFRTYGPDLTGPFLGDAGALGIKARVTLRLIAAPKAEGYLTFNFDACADMLSAMSEIARRGLAGECFGTNPYLSNERLWDDDDLGKDLRTLAAVATKGPSLLSGIIAAGRIAVKGRRALKDLGFGMHVTVDGVSEAAVEAAKQQIRNIVGRTGVEYEATIPRATRSMPFHYPNQIMGSNGHRWVPTNGVFPHSRAVTIVDEIHEYFEANAALLAEHQIEWGFVAFAIGSSAILCEPMLYWPDKPQDYHERVMEPDHFRKMRKFPENVRAREAAAHLRRGLTELFMMRGCAHLQIGKTYRYRESRNPDTYALLEAIKSHVDPNGRMNPHALGLIPRGAVA